MGVLLTVEEWGSGFKACGLEIGDRTHETFQKTILVANRKLHVLDAHLPDDS